MIFRIKKRAFAVWRTSFLLERRKTENLRGAVHRIAAAKNDFSEPEKQANMLENLNAKHRMCKIKEGN